jgi:hypothetical protein
MPRRVIAALVCVPLVFGTACRWAREKAAVVAGPTEAGVGNWVRLGPVGLSIESVRLGKVRMGGMMGQAGESKDDVFQVRTRLKLFDPAATVKQDPLQKDGMMFFGSGLKLTDAAGTPYKEVGGFGFDSVKGRRSKPVELTAANPEATDLLTFEAKAGDADELVLTIPGTWQEKQADGRFLQPQKPGSFTFRLPKAVWAAPPRTIDAGPGNWYRIGPVGAEVTAVRFGKVKMAAGGPFGGPAESAEDVVSVAVRFRVFEPAGAVKKAPFVPDGGLPFSSAAVVLADPTGKRFPAAAGRMFDRITGRQSGDVELTAANPEVADLLTFDGKAAAAGELILSLWPNWRERAADGSWVEPDTDDEFRFRIPRSMWDSGR